jgi:hypothetical protein
MTDEIVHPKDISPDFLLELFNTAFMNVSFDDDGDVRVEETYGCWLFPQSNGRYIRLMSQFRPNPDGLLPERLNFVNKVNDEMMLIRAYLKENGGFGFDYYIPVEGGITKRNIVATTRNFLALLSAVARLDTEDLIG